jgi:hypothetical protein
MDERAECFEKQMRPVLEACLRGLSETRDSLAGLAAQLAGEVDSATKTDERGRGFAPDQYTLTLHPDQATLLASLSPEAQADLSRGLNDALRQCGFLLARQPHVTLASDPTLARGEMRAISWHSSDPLKFSKETTTAAEQGDQPPPGAFLIVSGKRHFALDRPLVNIGRRLDNHLVLDDPHISRAHAQLRVQSGRYVIVDMGSTAGTRVNGRLIKEQTLRPGDLITLATVELIYGEDTGGPPEVTPPYTPPFKAPQDRDMITPLDLRTDALVRKPTPGEKDKKR